MITVATMSIALAGSDTLPNWDYQGAANPSRWGELSPEYETCSTGLYQSPIDLSSSTVPEKEGNIEIKYNDTPLVINNNGHTIQIDYQPGSYAVIDQEKYELKQFHFHTPSEHTIEGEASALELHLVHQNEQGKLAVIGVFIEEGKNHTSLATIWNNISGKEGIEKVAGEMINASDFLPTETAYYHYQGSLTTPPCSENVSWNVMKKFLTASRQQIEQFMDLYPMNARPIQEHNERIVELIENK